MRLYLAGDEAKLFDHFVMLIVVLFTYLAWSVIFNLYWHPLSKYPGPRLWSAFRFPYVLSFWQGNLVHDIYRLHRTYGEIVRVAPTEISFANKQAWQDIHCHRAGHHHFPKNPVWWGEVPGRSPSIISAPNEVDHERIRKLLTFCFTKKALDGQEDTVRYHTDLLISKLRQRMEDKVIVINIVDWCMFLTFDILGDLAFGESFHCLSQSAFHPWVQNIFNSFKMGAALGALRLYFSNSIDSFLIKLTPKSVSSASKLQYDWAVQKVHQRMNLETIHEDFFTHIIPNNSNSEDGMSVAEIESNASLLTVAGSETCGTVLCGTINHLVKSPFVRKRLTEEIRDTFSRAEDLNFAALADLPYLNAVVEEGLRTSPPNTSGLSHLVPIGGDTVCGEWFPENTTVSVHQWSTFRSNHFYCPNSFLPERWLRESRTDQTSPFHGDDLEAVQAFSVGKWSCIGKQLAYGELRLVLAKLVWNFDIELASNGRDVEWSSQKSWFVMEKQPFDVCLVDARPQK